MSQPRTTVLVVGGGAAGLAAAVAASRAGARVTILERMERVGRKLLATGNGRCNFTNARLEPGRYHGRDPSFAAPALERFGLAATLAFFGELGVFPREEEGGKVFPRSGQASAVLDALRFELERRGVEVLCGAETARISPRAGSLQVSLQDGRVFEAARVILAPGGKAAPSLGSNGRGFELARALGHTVVEPFPALVRLRVEAPFLKRLKGVKVEALASVGRGRDVLRREAGEVLFTESGLSGPPILQLSRPAVEAVRAGQPAWLELDLFPDLDPGTLARMAGRALATEPGRGHTLGLGGLLNRRLVPVVLAEAGLDAPSGSGTEAARRLGGLLKAWRFAVAGPGSWNEAQVTAGGVDTSLVDPLTMESRLVRGLHFAGEVLDIDGDCGGYNLQWAWSSGLAAGAAAAV